MTKATFEFNRLVAEKVLKYKRWTKTRAGDNEYDRPMWCLFKPEVAHQNICGPQDWRPYEPEDEINGDFWDNVPSFSTYMPSTLEVLDKLHELGFEVTINFYDGKAFVEAAKPSWQGSHVERGSYDELPKLICLTALAVTQEET